MSVTRRPRLALALAAVCVAGTAVTPLAAQTAPAARTHADSLAELASLDALVRRNSRDADGWHRKGLLAWAMMDGRQDGIAQGTEYVAFSRGADSSLRLAVRIAPDSVHYALDLMNYLLSSRLTSLHAAAWGVARQAIAAAERLGRPALLAEARDAVGMVAWRQYETFSHRPHVGDEDMLLVTYNSAAHHTSIGKSDRASSDQGRADKELRPGPGVALSPIGNGTLEAVGTDPKKRADVTRQMTDDDAQNFGGFTDYATAEQLFVDALAADPESRTARRHLYMVLAERERWEELRHVAAARADLVPDDGVSRLTLALAEHRLGDEDAAARDFDRGFALFVPAERQRLTRLTRIMAPRRMPGDTSTAPDSVAFAAATPAERAAMTRRFWADNDPIALTAVNERRNEFYARVIYSELLWSVDEIYLRGSESGRGQMFIRYGPPAVILRRNDRTEWRYAYQTLEFSTPPGFGIAHYQQPDTAGADWQTAVTPVFFRDPPAIVPDSATALVARFRAKGDSSGVYVAARTPLAKLVDGVRRGSAGVDVGFLLTDADALPVLRDSTRVRVSVEDAGVADVRAWQATVPAGDYRYRVEGFGVASRRGARAAGRVAARPARGFGLSDLLIAASVTPPPSLQGARWTDFATVPNAGVYVRGAPVGLLWETYALAAGPDSTSRYRVSVAVEPASPGAGRVVARILGGLFSRGAAPAAGTRLSYDRQVRATPASVDYLSLDVGTAPSGDYLIRVTVDDSITHRSTTTSARFRIIE